MTMLSLFTRDEYAALGFQALCDSERVPWRRVHRIDDDDTSVLVAIGADLSADEVSATATRRALVLDGGFAFAERVLGASAQRISGGAVLPLAQPIWPIATARTAARFETHALRVPRAVGTRVCGPVRGRLLASLRTDERAAGCPAVVRVGPCVWSAIDLGSAFADLLTEQYAPPLPASRSRLRAAARRVAESLYYAAPAGCRRIAQRTSYRALARRLTGLGADATRYPCDATGWLAGELMLALLRQTGEPLLRIERWPAPYTSAAVLSHDLEPRRYAYTRGLQRLLERVTPGERRAFGLVAEAAARDLPAGTIAPLRDHEVFCHGLSHHGEQVHCRAEVARTVRRARALLERVIGRPVRGYRSPRLDRSADLDWALDEAGFAFDSSHPDVDRENARHYGRGVRVNLPYRPPIRDEDGRWRGSRCLELPLTAPDCIQPLFAGETVTALRAAVTEKAAYVRATGGLYVALVHAGVFGDADAICRETHLAHVAAALRHPGTWLTTPEAVVRWWCAREQVHVRIDNGTLRVRNGGADVLAGVVVTIERDGALERIELPALAAGSEHIVAAAPPRQENGAHAA